MFTLLFIMPLQRMTTFVLLAFTSDAC